MPAISPRHHLLWLSTQTARKIGLSRGPMNYPEPPASLVRDYDFQESGGPIASPGETAPFARQV